MASINRLAAAVVFGTFLASCAESRQTPSTEYVPRPGVDYLSFQAMIAGLDIYRPPEVSEAEWHSIRNCISAAAGIGVPPETEAVILRAINTNTVTPEVDALFVSWARISLLKGKPLKPSSESGPMRYANGDAVAARNYHNSGRIIESFLAICGLDYPEPPAALWMLAHE